MPVYYMATHRFDHSSEGWDAYAKWRDLPQLVEVVSIENGSVVPRNELRSDEWDSIAQPEEVGPHPLCFRDLDRLQACLARFAPVLPFNLLCVIREPAEAPVPPRSQVSFTFLGYDLVEERTGVSALTNCGSGFPAVLREDDLSEFGLVRTFERAKEIRWRLPCAYPQEPHAHCNLWAVFRAGTFERSEYWLPR